MPLEGGTQERQKNSGVSLQHQEEEEDTIYQQKMEKTAISWAN